MKLWLLRPIEGRPEWKPWYDKAFGFVVRAENETQARALANEEGGNENGSKWVEPAKGEAKGHYGPVLRPWLDEKASTCEELPVEGAAEVVIRDFAAA